MILAFEMTWTGVTHAPANGATLEAVATALPGQVVRMHAEASHLAELRKQPALARLEWRTVDTSPHYPGRTHIVSARRGFTEFRTIARALQAAPAREEILILLLSATPTAIVAAALLASLDRRVLGVQVALHGNLNEVVGWRSRNPLRRAFDLPALLAMERPPWLRFLLLEDAIRRALAEIAPGAARKSDVLLHPANAAEMPLVTEVSLSQPVRVGLVGQATEAKGIGPFLETARLLKARHPGKVEFYLVGRPATGMDLAPLAILDHPADTAPLSRAAFLERLAPLHYVFLPLQPEYYRLSASGAFLDAITWLKPVIATDLPIIADAFAEFGDIGHLCLDVPAMQAALEAIVTAPDPARYAAQRAALERARATRLPAALAARYRAIVEQHFPRLLAS